MKKTNPYRVNPAPCIDDKPHVWSNSPLELAKLCLRCFRAKMILK